MLFDLSQRSANQAKFAGKVDYGAGMDLLQFKINALAEDTDKIIKVYSSSIDNEANSYLTKAMLVDAIMMVNSCYFCFISYKL